MFKKILIPVDGSDFPFKAVKTAASLAEKYDSKITLLYVISLPFSTPVLSPEVGGIVPQNVFDEVEKEGKQVLSRAAAEFTKASAETKLRTGHPAMEIIDESKGEYDLVVMGSRGLGELKGFLMGSVSDRVTHHAGCTVMVVH